MYNSTSKFERNRLKTIKVDEETWKKLKIMAVEEETTIAKLVKGMVDDKSK